MDTKLSSIGYDFEPSKYSPGLGYSRLKIIITSQPAQRFFDVKALHVPTFDGKLYHHTRITRHELEPVESFQLCLGELRLVSHREEILRAFSFGGFLRAAVEMGDLFCDITSTAPILKLKDDPKLGGGVVVDELMEFLAEKQARMAGHEHELYSRLARVEPYSLFLSCLVSLQQRADSMPVHLRRDKYHKLVSQLHRAIKIVRECDGWDGHSPSLDDLL